MLGLSTDNPDMFRIHLSVWPSGVEQIPVTQQDNELIPNRIQENVCASVNTPY